MKRPANEPKSDSRYPAERERVKELTPPALVFPHGVLGNSTSGFAYDSNGKFGPFKNQLLVCDQTFSVVNRGFLEKVNGVYQGAAFSFLKGFGSGNISAYMHPDGTLFIGGTDRGWGHVVANASHSTASHGKARCLSRFTRCEPSRTGLS